MSHGDWGPLTFTHVGTKYTQFSGVTSIWSTKLKSEILFCLVFCYSIKILLNVTGVEIEI